MTGRVQKEKKMKETGLLILQKEKLWGNDSSFQNQNNSNAYSIKNDMHDEL